MGRWAVSQKRVMILVTFSLHSVFSVVTQRSSPEGTLRDDTKNGCVADYLTFRNQEIRSATTFSALGPYGSRILLFHFAVSEMMKLTEALSKILAESFLTSSYVSFGSNVFSSIHFIFGFHFFKKHSFSSNDIIRKN